MGRTVPSYRIAAEKRKSMGVLYPDPDANESKTLFQIHSKTRDKYSDEMIPLMQTMFDSFKFTQLKK